MKAAGVEFKLSDLLYPIYPRTRRFLSAIINFAKYREEKFGKFSELDEEADRLAEELMAAENLELQASETLQNLNSQVESEEPEAKKLFLKYNELRESINVWNQTQASCKEERSQLKSELIEMRNKAEKYSLMREELEKNKAKLLSRILQDPDKTVKMLEDKRARRDRENEALSNSEKRRNELLTRKSLMEDECKSFDKCNGILSQISIEIERLNSEKKTIKDHKNKIANSENSLRELDVNIQKVNRQLQASKERSGSIQQQQENTYENLNQELNQLRQKKTQVEKDHNLTLCKIKQMDLEFTQLESENISLERDHQEYLRQMQSQIEILLSQLRKYHLNVHQSMKSSLLS